MAEETPNPGPAPWDSPAPSASASPVVPGSSGYDSSTNSDVLQAYQDALKGGGGYPVGAGASTDITERSLVVSGTQITTIGDLRTWFWSLPESQWRALAAKFQDANLLPPGGYSQSDVWNIYQNIAVEAAEKYRALFGAGQIPYRYSGDIPSVEDILDNYLEHPLGEAKGGTGGAPDTYTVTNQQLNITDPDQAHGLLEEVLKNSLGRAPTAAEQAAFLAALNARQRANPMVAATTYTKDQASGQYSTSTTTTGGVDASAFADEYADRHNEAEAGAYQMGTTYMDAFLQALSAPGGL